MSVEVRLLVTCLLKLGCWWHVCRSSAVGDMSVEVRLLVTCLLKLGCWWHVCWSSAVGPKGHAYEVSLPIYPSPHFFPATHFQRLKEALSWNNTYLYELTTLVLIHIFVIYTTRLRYVITAWPWHNRLSYRWTFSDSHHLNVPNSSPEILFGKRVIPKFLAFRRLNPKILNILNRLLLSY